MDHSTRFQQAVKKRDTLRGKLDRLQGKLESAQSRLSEVEAQCRAKNIDPSQIDELIEKVEKILLGRVENIEQRVQEAEDQLAPYLEEVASL